MTPPAKTPLGEVFRRCGSDKAWPHCYDKVYSRLFPDRQAPLDILEVGVADGQSLRAWKEYYPNALVVGVDKEPGPPPLGCERHQIEQTDLVGLWQAAVKDRRFDLIVEDASHIWHKQLITMALLYPALKLGGWYCLEDVAGDSYGGFRFEECLGCFRGEYIDLSDDDYPDGGHLFLLRRVLR